MKITTRHPMSRYGVPVILDDAGAVMDYGPGLEAVMQALGWDRHTLAERCGVSLRTTDGWRYAGRMPEVRALNVLADALADLPRPRRRAE